MVFLILHFLIEFRHSICHEMACTTRSLGLHTLPFVQIKFLPRRAVYRTRSICPRQTKKKNGFGVIQICITCPFFSYAALIKAEAAAASATITAQPPNKFHRYSFLLKRKRGKKNLAAIFEDTNALSKFPLSIYI